MLRHSVCSLIISLTVCMLAPGYAAAQPLLLAENVSSKKPQHPLKNAANKAPKTGASSNRNERHAKLGAPQIQKIEEENGGLDTADEAPEFSGSGTTAPQSETAITEQRGILPYLEQENVLNGVGGTGKTGTENARVMRMEEEPTGDCLRGATGDCNPPSRPAPKTGGGDQTPRPTSKPCITVNMEEEPTGCE